jgi:hypothetical protein
VSSDTQQTKKKITYWNTICVYEKYFTFPTHLPWITASSTGTQVRLSFFERISDTAFESESVVFGMPSLWFRVIILGWRPNRSTIDVFTNLCMAHKLVFRRVYIMYTLWAYELKTSDLKSNVQNAEWRIFREILQEFRFTLRLKFKHVILWDPRTIANVQKVSVKVYHNHNHNHHHHHHHHCHR